MRGRPKRWRILGKRAAGVNQRHKPVFGGHKWTRVPDGKTWFVSSSGRPRPMQLRRRFRPPYCLLWTSARGVAVPKKEISIDQLTLQMYVVGCDRSWLETPFLSHKFLIEEPGQIEALRRAGI